MSVKNFTVSIEYNGELEPEYEKQVADNIAAAVWHELENVGLTPIESHAYAEGVVVEPDNLDRAKLVELVKDIDSNTSADIFFDAEKYNEPGLQSEIDALFENIKALKELLGIKDGE